jgi:hypothetical protein
MTFNLKKYLEKTANYEGAQGYFLGQTRAWINCTKRHLDAGSTPNDAWNGCLDEYQKGDGCMSWVKKYAADLADELQKRGQISGGDYQLQMAPYWDRIDKKVKAGKSVGEAVMETLDECKKDADKIPPK